MKNGIGHNIFATDSWSKQTYPLEPLPDNEPIWVKVVRFFVTAITRKRR